MGRPRAAAFWIALAVLALARLVAPLSHSMTWWALDLQRFLPSAAAWIPWLLCAAVLIPAVSTRLVPSVSAFGDLLVRGGPVAWLVAALPPVLAVALFPDRVWFLGDFQLRQATLGTPVQAVPFWYPYCLPLDLFLHDTLGRWVIHRFGLVENEYGRWLGAIEAGLLGVFAARFARALGVRGALAALSWGAIAFSGALALYTGYDKAFTELTLLSVAAGALTLEIASGRPSLMGLSVIVAIALFLHRSAIGLVPGLGFGLFATARREGTWPERGRAVLPALIPLAALGVMGPKILGIVAHTDGMHFAPTEVKQLGLLAATFAPSRLLDLANVLILLSPLAIPALAVAFAGRRAPAGSEIAALGCLASPMLVAAFFMHPSQGLMRDWDTFAAPGVMLSMLAAWTVCRTLDASSAWLAVAALVGVFAPTAQWLAHSADRERGLARVEALIAGPPVRSRHERASAWEFLGLRRTDLGDFAGASDAFAHEAELEPSPQVLRHWAVIEASRGDLGRAIDIYRGLVERFPNEGSAWFEMAVLLARSGHVVDAKQAVNRALEIDPSRAEWRSFLESIGRGSEVSR